MAFDPPCPPPPQPGTPDDPAAALLGKVAQGDRAAFRALYDQTSPKLLGVALTLLRRRDLAEDALQHAYLRIWSRADSFDPARGTALAWMARIVRNAAFDLRHRAAAHTADSLEQAEDVAVPAIPIAERLDIAGALSGLSADQRAAVLLGYGYGYTSEETARELRVPLGTAKTWLRRGAERLRVRLRA